MKKIFAIMIILFSVVMVIVQSYAYAGEGGMKYHVISEVPQAKWNILAQKKIYFGHQSVGFNIIDGIKSVMEENPSLKLNIIESHKKSAFEQATFLHSRVGTNKDPVSKINEFSQFLREGIGKSADVVFLKICFVDIVGDTNINKVFSIYNAKINEIEKMFPNLQVIHFTVPLRVVEESWKIFIKKKLGKKVWEYKDNIARNKYNRLLREKYEAGAMLFDLAAAESTLPDGSRQTFVSAGGDVYYGLYPGYSSDGGHLNKQGSKIIAEKFLLFMVNHLLK